MVYNMRCIQGRLSNFRSNCYPPATSRAAFLGLGVLLATASLAQSFTHSFASCRALVKESQRLQPTRLFGSLTEGGSQSAAAITVGGGDPDKSLWPIRFTKDEIDGVKEKLANSQSTDVFDGITRNVLQWISTSCVLVDDAGGEISHIMAIDAFHDFPMEKGTMVAQEPRLKNPPPVINETLMDGPSFLQTLLETMYANNRWNGYTLMVLMESDDLLINLNRHPTPQDALNDLDDKMTGPPVQIRSISPELQVVEFTKDRFTQAIINDTYVNRKRAKAVKKFLQSTQRPIRQVNARDIPAKFYSPIRIDFVKRQGGVGESLSTTLAGVSDALDKRRCVVVAGESGSGKTTFALKSFNDERYDVFYAVIQRQDYGNQDEPPEDGLNTCRDAVQKVIVAVNRLADESVVPGRQKQSCLDLLYSAKTCLNKSRNAWARQVAERAWSRVLRNAAQDDVERWWDGNLEKRDRPSRLAMVLDEVTNLNLAEGLVDICRDLIIQFEENLSQDYVSFMLCGTGLDDLRPHQRIGTDPSKSSVVIVSEPDFDALQKGGILTSVEVAAIDRGVYGRVLSRNSRMLFQAVLPILKVGFLRRPYPFRDNLQEVLVSVTSSWLTMRYAIIIYLSSNAVGMLPEWDMNDLLKDAYLYHLLLCLLDVKTHSNSWSNCLNEVIWLSKHKQVGTLLRLMRTRGKIPERQAAFVHELTDLTAHAEESSSNSLSDIFAAGLVANKTSVALKYLACMGRVDPLAKSDGAGFEKMVGASLARMMEALGYEVHRVTLDRAWPEKATRNIKYTYDDIANLKATLMRRGKNATRQDGNGAGKSNNDGNEGNETTSWTSFLRSENLQCIIFRQGVFNAQGPDLFMLYQCGESGQMLMDSIQAKHRTVPTKRQLANWFQSVGVAKNATSPKNGRAGWSYAGLEAFRDFVQDQTGKPVELGRRIIASSAPAADWQATSFAFQLANEQQSALAAARIWPKEMFEPMISVLDSNKSASKPRHDEWGGALTY